MEHCSEAGEAVEPTVGLPSPTRTLLQVGDPAGARAGQVKCKELSNAEKAGDSSFHLSEA